MTDYDVINYKLGVSVQGETESGETVSSGITWIECIYNETGGMHFHIWVNSGGDMGFWGEWGHFSTLFFV